MSRKTDETVAQALREILEGSETEIIDQECRGRHLTTVYAATVADRALGIEEAALDRDVIAGSPNAFNQILQPVIRAAAEAIRHALPRRRSRKRAA